MLCFVARCWGRDSYLSWRGFLCLKFEVEKDDEGRKAASKEWRDHACLSSNDSGRMLL